MLKGSRVLVTGGSSGIGRAMANALASEGARVVITGRDARRLAEVADASEHIDAVVCDVTDADQIAALQQQISSTGGIDMLVNCAGVMHFFDVTSGYPLERQLQEIDIDVAGPVRMVDAFLPRTARATVDDRERQLGARVGPLRGGTGVLGCQGVRARLDGVAARTVEGHVGSGRRAAAAGHRHTARRRAEPELQADAARRSRRGIREEASSAATTRSRRASRGS